MAIGETRGSGNNYQGNNSNNKGIYEPTYYSRFRISKNNNLSMSITYRSGLMIIEINSPEDNGFKLVPVQSIYLSPMKANLLVNEMKAFLEYRAGNKIDENRAFGVNAGLAEKVTYIAFSTDDDKKIYCTIGKFDSTGTIIESTRYEFVVDYNYSLEWNNLSANDLEKVYDNDIEFTVLMKAIEDFGRAMSGAYAYAAFDLNRYEASKESKRMDQVFDKLGIERRSNGYSGANSGNNFLSNANSSSKPTSFENIEDLLD